MNDDASRMPIDPSPEQMQQIGCELIDRIVSHLSTLSRQRVSKRRTNQEFNDSFGEELPITGTSINESIELFFDKIVPGMTHVNHPRFHAFIPCPSSFAGAIGMMMAAGTNPFVGSWLGGASLASLELMVIDWIKQSLHLGNEYQGILTSGGSIANLIGLASARSKFGRKMLEEGVIYVSTQGHASVQKAAVVLGFNEDNIRSIDTNESYQMKLDNLEYRLKQDLEKGLTPFLVAANAGTTNTGAIDDLLSLSQFCQENELWFHVDAAYGGFAAMAPEIREMMTGLEKADSITLDPHKWLYCPMGVGCTLVKRGTDLDRAFATQGSYLRDLSDKEINFLDRGPELSRPARALPVWMVMRTIGQEGLIQQIRSDISLAKQAAEILEKDERFEVISLGLSIVTFRLRCKPGETEPDRAKRDEALTEAILEDGTLMLSSTTLNGESALRFVVMNPQTTLSQVETSLNRIFDLVD